MGFRQDAYATIWKVEDKGKYSEVQLSISKKDKKTGSYQTDFSGYVRFIGTAHENASLLKERDRIKIKSCDVTNKYDKEKKVTYTNYCVFAFDRMGENTSNATAEPNVTVTNDDDLPF